VKGAPKHFLDLDCMDARALRRILELGAAFKKGKAPTRKKKPLDGRTLVMIFEKPSTRTRVSFEVGMQQLGGRVVVMSEGDSQLGRGETIADTAKVLSRYCDIIMLRTSSPDKLQQLAEHATVPVINGLTDESHPCQLMADVMTFEEHRGPIAGRRVAWTGDGNNVANTWVQAAVQFDFALRLACPEQLQPNPKLIAWAKRKGGDVSVTHDPHEAADGADLVVTDTWLSMGQVDRGNRHNLLTPYRVDRRLMARAKRNALFMHCLPAHRGDEVTAEVIDGPQSVVWDEAENRLHAQKGILAWCLS
jgi:ornithine carbamoyltransferase